MDNEFEHAEEIKKEFYNLMREFLKSKRVKNWYRAWFVGGIINKVDNYPRLLKCSAAKHIFYLDPYGELRPCNVLEESMGNLKKESFEEIWSGKRAEDVRLKVENCDKHCWMIGSVADQMKAKIHIPTKWVLKNKWNISRRKKIEIPRPYQRVNPDQTN